MTAQNDRSGEASENPSNTPSAYHIHLRPVYIGVVKSTFEKLPIVSLPLEEILIPTKNGSMGLQNDWIDTMLSAIWAAVDQLYKENSVSVSDSDFHRHFPSGESDDELKELREQVEFMPGKDLKVHYTFEDIRKKIESFCEKSQFANIFLNVDFKEQIKKDIIFTDFLFTDGAISDYLVMNEDDE